MIDKQKDYKKKIEGLEKIDREKKQVLKANLILVP